MGAQPCRQCLEASVATEAAQSIVPIDQSKSTFAKNLTVVPLVADEQAEVIHFPKAAESGDDTCTMEFQVPGAENREVVFSCRPVGLDFSKTMPITIIGVCAGSHAESLGLQAGWVLSKVNGEDTLSVEAAESINKIKLACKKLKDMEQAAHDTCTMEFQVPGAKNREVVFTCRPLGLDFSKTMPLTIKGTCLGSHAEFLGVQAGWVLFKINGEDMFNVEVAESIKKIKLACKKLKVIGDMKLATMRSSWQASSGAAAEQ